MPGGTVKVRVLGVVLGAPDHDTLWAGVTGLLTSMQAGFHEVEAATSGQSFGSYTTPWGASSNLVATSGQTFVVWSDTPIQVDLTTRPIQSGFKGDLVGRITFTFNGTTKTVDLALAKDVPDPGFGWRLAHPGGLGT